MRLPTVTFWPRPMTASCAFDVRRVGCQLKKTGVQPSGATRSPAKTCLASTCGSCEALSKAQGNSQVYMERLATAAIKM